MTNAIRARETHTHTIRSPCPLSNFHQLTLVSTLPRGSPACFPCFHPPGVVLGHLMVRMVRSWEVLGALLFVVVCFHVWPSSSFIHHGRIATRWSSFFLKPREHVCGCGGLTAKVRSMRMLWDTESLASSHRYVNDLFSCITCEDFRSQCIGEGL